MPRHSGRTTGGTDALWVVLFTQIQVHHHADKTSRPPLRVSDLSLPRADFHAAAPFLRRAFLLRRLSEATE